MNKKILQILFFSSILLIFNSFITEQNPKRAKKFYKKFTPPGCVKINNNLYCDSYEITNVDWREYFFWLKKIYGKNSKEYTAALPDTNVWLSADSSLHILSEIYLRLPNFDDFPVVGISQKQATNFSKWRTDRVFETMLVKNKIIKFDNEQNSKTYFSIEKYFNGNYKNYKPDSNFLIYPAYQLPKYSEFVTISEKNDSIIKKSKKKKNIKINDSGLVFNDELIVLPVKSTKFNYQYKKEVVYNLKNNVSEWLEKDNICIGGNWKNEKNNIDTIYVSIPKSYTGFRNVCVLKKWE